MTSVRAGLSRPAVWVVIALFGALTGAALQLALGGTTGRPSLTSSVAVVATEVAGARVAAGAEPSGAPGAAPAGTGTTGPTALVEGTGSASGASPAAVAAAPAANRTEWRLRVPALGVDAQVISLGFTADGQLDVPRDGTSVGWYEISAQPGAPGNTLLGGHFDWGGSAAVFWRLSNLEAGDQIVLDNGSSELVYEVSETTAVSWDHPVAEILATEGTGSSLTLFTCGGSFDRSRSGYDQRSVIRAVQVSSTAPLTAQR